MMAVVLGGLIAGGLWLLNCAESKATPTTQAASGPLTPDQLAKDWQKYRGQRVQVRGTVNGTSDRDGVPLVYLLGDRGGNAHCFFSTGGAADMAGNPRTVTVEGIVSDGTSDTAILHQCRRIFDAR